MIRVYELSPSKGFISASLAIVAHAPLVAIENISHIAFTGNALCEILTCGKWMMLITHVAPHSLLDCLISSKVNRVRWTYSSMSATIVAICT